MNNSPLHSVAQIPRERGAALIISLLILLTMTIIGISAIRGVTLEEKMANNARNHNVASQAAEEGLIFGETNLPNYTGMQAQDAFYKLSNSYTDNASWASDGIALATQLKESRKPAEYAIEFVGIEKFSKTEGQQGDRDAQNRRSFFRVIARGYGGTDTAKVHLESVIDTK